ncbi:MAG: hypothetical protein AAF389_04465 [Gemmatimonadota bacterium]
MLRECRRVLVPGGKIAVLTIAVPAGLADDDAAMALELGPSRVGAPDTLANMMHEAGFRGVEEVNETPRFREVIIRSLARLRALETELRTGEGADGFEAEWGKKSRLLEGVDRGLLVRTLVVAEAP